MHPALLLAVRVCADEKVFMHDCNKGVIEHLDMALVLVGRSASTSPKVKAANEELANAIRALASSGSDAQTVFANNTNSDRQVLTPAPKLPVEGTWTGDVVRSVEPPHGGHGFFLLDNHRTPIISFGYSTKGGAERAANAMCNVIDSATHIVAHRR
jgi:hypothetical protein